MLFWTFFVAVVFFSCSKNYNLKTYNKAILSRDIDDLIKNYDMNGILSFISENEDYIKQFRCQKGGNFLMYILRNFHGGPECLKRVSEKYFEIGGNPETVDDANNTLLHLSLSFGSEHLSQMLVNKMQNLSVFNSEGNTPIKLAISKNYKEVVASILKKYPKIVREQCDLDGNYVYMICSVYGRVDIFKLIKKECEEEESVVLNLNLKNSNGKTATFLAVESHQYEMLKELINAKSDINKESKEISPIMLAGHLRIMKAVEVLIAGGADFHSPKGEILHAIPKVAVDVAASMIAVAVDTAVTSEGSLVGARASATVDCFKKILKSDCNMSVVDRTKSAFFINKVRKHGFWIRYLARSSKKADEIKEFFKEVVKEMKTKIKNLDILHKKAGSADAKELKDRFSEGIKSLNFFISKISSQDSEMTESVYDCTWMVIKELRTIYSSLYINMKLGGGVI